MRYIVDKNIFKRRLFEAGYKSLLDFSRRTTIHRNTILNYLSGKDVFLPSFSQAAAALGADPFELIEAVSDTKVDVPRIDEIRHIVAKIVKADADIAVVLLGSRASKEAKEYSDWDIGITRGQYPIDAIAYLHIKNMVDELSEDIPRMIDVVNLDSAPAWFLEGIIYEPLFLDGNREAYLYFKGVIYGVRKKEGQA